MRRGDLDKMIFFNQSSALKRGPKKLNLEIFFRLILYRVAKTHRIPYLYRSFSAKVTYI